MTPREIATIVFTEADSGNDAVAIVRQCGKRLAVALSVQDNGDLEVLLDVETATRLLEAIKVGIDVISCEAE
ncbi:hypothetical protein [Thermopirellula anaerolimosa]